MADAMGYQRVLVVTAHPDDVDFGAAGTVATFTESGTDVVYCIVTDGEAGGADRTMARSAMAEIRRAEQTTAAKHVGVTDLHFLGYPDGRVVSTLELRRDISRVIRQVQPDLVITQSSERNYERIYASHPDHLAAGEAAMCAVYPDARNPFAHTELLDEGLEPWSVPETWLMAGPKPNQFVDITDVADRKVEALCSHVSQHTDRAAMEELLRNWGAVIGQVAGYPDGRLAEGFLKVATA